MKKSIVFIVFSLLFICFCFSANAQIKVSSTGKVKIGATTDASKSLEVVGDASISSKAWLSGDVDINGNVGIGYNPSSSYKLYVSANSRMDNLTVSQITIGGGYGGIWSVGNYHRELLAENGYLGSSADPFNDIYVKNAVHVTSDSSMKENIIPFTVALEKVLQLKAVKYDLKKSTLISAEYEAEISDERYLNKIEKERKDKIGFLGQDIVKVLPEVVHICDSTGRLSISYSEIIPVLTKAIQEQQLIIENMQSEIDELKGGSLKSITAIGFEEYKNLDKSILYQNAPNPFGETTSIRYSLPDETTNADIIIYDMTGKQLKRIPLIQLGESKIEISGGEMDAGMYMYSMIVENQLVDTKQMVLYD